MDPRVKPAGDERRCRAQTVIAGLDPAIHQFRRRLIAGQMDPRVKPAGDEPLSSDERVLAKVVMPGLDPAIHQFRRRLIASQMDPRVKPAGDEPLSSDERVLAKVVMPGLDPGIHRKKQFFRNGWIAGSSVQPGDIADTCSETWPTPFWLVKSMLAT
jgi:hypothetical protein